MTRAAMLLLSLLASPALAGTVSRALHAWELGTAQCLACNDGDAVAFAVPRWVTAAGAELVRGIGVEVPPRTCTGTIVTSHPDAARCEVVTDGARVRPEVVVGSGVCLSAPDGKCAFAMGADYFRSLARKRGLTERALLLEYLHRGG